ncbi:MAG: hypothetical protein CL827_03615 [Crocinitomicaceae bacterium]|nr:hypothetical protein [Crocinitomicaceae bacterium]
MITNIKISSLFFIIFITSCIYGQTIESKLSLEKGNQSYIKGDYNTSSSNYNNSIISDESNLDAFFNNGNSSLMAGKFEEARNYYKNYIDKSESEEDKSKAHYNVGNSFLTEYAKETKETGKSNGEYLQKAINEYKQSLRYNPQDKDARYNLSYATKLIQNQENKDPQNKDQENKDQENKNQENKNQKEKDPQNKDQQNNDQKEKDPNNKNQENKDQKEKEQQKKEQKEEEEKKAKQKESKEQAIKNLDAINGDEEKVLLKVNRKKGDQKKKSKTKDW